MEAAARWVSKGQTRHKIQVGRLNIHGRMDVAADASAEHREDFPSEDEARVGVVREAVGDSVKLMVDAKTGKRLGHAGREAGTRHGTE